MSDTVSMNVSVIKEAFIQEYQSYLYVEYKICIFFFGGGTVCYSEVASYTIYCMY